MEMIHIVSMLAGIGIAAALSGLKGALLRLSVEI